MGASPSPEVELAEGYYLDNLEHVLRTVGERDGDLLSPAEDAFLRDFGDLDLSARRLWVRLVSRRGPVFRRDRLDYAEIPDLDAAIVGLTAGDFLDATPPLDGEIVLRRVRLAEARNLAADLLSPPLPSRKRDLVSRLLEERDPATLEAALRRAWSWVSPLRVELLDTFRLLYFGNLRQDWTELLLRDLGVLRFEPVRIRREHRLFPERRAVEDALAAHRARRAQHEAREAGRRDDIVAIGQALKDRRWHPVAAGLADRVLLHAGRAAERSGDLDGALDLYGRCRTPPARERRARVLERRGDEDAALRLADRIAREPRDETERLFGPRFGHRLRRRRDPSLPRLPRPRRPRRVLEIPRTSSDATAGSPPPGPPFPEAPEPPLPSTTSIETRVLQHLAHGGREALFAENWLWSSLFGLAFWDVLFAPVPGAFQHPFQFAPLDLHDPAFASRRRELVAARLADLRTRRDLAPELLDLWEDKRHTANRFVAWSDRAREGLDRALRWIDGPSLAIVSERMLRDLRRHRRGFPDLLLESPAAPGFELWEIKGPGDTLRPEQGAWIDHLNAHGLPARVVRVRWTGPSEPDATSGS